MDKPSSGLPSAKCKAAFGFCGGLLDVQEVGLAAIGGCGHGLAVDEVFKGFPGSRFSILWGGLHRNHLHRHDPSDGLELPGLWRPNDQGGAPKLGRQLATDLPTQHANNRTGQGHLPWRTLAPWMWGSSMMGPLAGHDGVKVRRHGRSTCLAMLRQQQESGPIVFERPLVATIPRPRRPNVGS